MYLVERLPRETGREYALRNIKKNIINLELAPGSKVSEQDLASEMGLSRTPVREALLELSKCKVVDVYPQKGSVVSLIDYQLVEEARFMRYVLECAVVQLVCGMAAPEQIIRLEENIRLQQFYHDRADMEKLMELDNDFHRLLFDIAQKSQVYDLTQNLSIHFDRVRNMALSAVKDLRIIQDHRDIVKAVKDRDSETAKAVMEQHLSRYRVDELMIREEYNPEYFKNSTSSNF